MKLNDAFVLVGCPLSPTFRADARLVGALESWRSKNVITYYPSSGATEIGYDMIVNFAKRIEPKPTHILFVDYDVLPRSNTLKKLLEHDKDIVSGVYPAIKKFKMSWCLSRKEPFKLMEIDDLPDNPFKVHIACNGMLLVKMEVFDKIEWPYWKTEYFTDGAKTGADIYFFDKARAAGYDLWVDPKVKCGHFKMVDLLGIVNNFVMKG
ncbi:hypothetical protein LCGC14_0538550 [marine sediment metagenome]|uniref:Glycosyltransferase 2-like domain-containing protein n=1 Tax=marine sediment metagenome TaxID=412755 RepID=A0A0F9RTK8_9ZZZZ